MTKKDVANHMRFVSERIEDSEDAIEEARQTVEMILECEPDIDIETKIRITAIKYELEGATDLSRKSIIAMKIASELEKDS